jgi:EAL domain-containing protein (putative c-di-GMP-specific phosphodiesterase class I)/GGDEF domain-containing protein
MTSVDADIPEFLRAVGEQLRASAVHFVRAGRPVGVRWSDPDVDADDGVLAPEITETLGHDWLLSREPNELSTVQAVDGWWLGIAAVGAPSLPLDGALVAVRDPAGPVTDAERDLLVFAARALSSLTGTAPLGAEREWRRSGHRAAAGLQALCQGLDARHGTLSAFAVRVDELAVVADVLGAGAADEVVRVTRRRIERWAAGAGRVLQLAGADFLVLRDDHPDQAAATADADRLRHLLAGPVDVGSARVTRSASIGVATPRGGPVSAAVLLAVAFGALREAHASGGNHVVLDGATRSCRLERLRLEVELQRAVHNDALRLYYQPEFDLRTGTLTGVEALLRWQHPERGLLQPEEFIAIAEASQAMVEVGEWVLREALRQLAQWQAEFPSTALTMRVNVAAAQFGSPTLVEFVLHEIARHGLSPAQVCLEITERTMPADLSELAAGLNALVKAGARSAIDDFGTGQSSFAHVRELPVDAIKIDRSFVGELIADTRSRAIVTAMMRLADALGLDVVAEGVESHEVAAELVRLGCVRGQGNLLGAAMRPEQVRGLLQAGCLPR